MVNRWDDFSIEEFTTQEVCQKFGVTEGRLYCWRKRGRGPAWYKKGNRIYYSRHAIDEWLRKRRVVISERKKEER
jgi:predicted site-specific integrase-resolvase